MNRTAVRSTMLLLLFAAVLPRASADEVPQAAPRTLAQLGCLSWDELLALYRNAKPGSLPNGFLQGRTFYPPETPHAENRERMANTLWKGKHFNAAEATLVNQWAGARAIRANIYQNASWLDGQPAWILDYRQSTLLWRDVRDEMREVSPGLHVGLMYLERGCCPRLKVFFALESCCK